MQIKIVSIFTVLGAFANPAQAIYQNGGFEQNSFSSWVQGGGSNPGLSGTEPFTGASVLINGNAVGPASIVGAGSDIRAPLLILPRVGQYTAKINDEASGAIISTVAQTDVISSADLDPSDNKPHVRFSFAPVLEDPAHSPNQQPYFYVRVKNTSDNTILFEQFAYSGQPGVQFQNGTGNWKYLPFQDVDATLPVSALNQNIETYLVAADCSLGAHAGYVYLDGFGSSTIPAQVTSTRIPAPTLSTLGLLALAGTFMGLGLLRIVK